MLDLFLSICHKEAQHVDAQPDPSEMSWSHFFCRSLDL